MRGLQRSIATCAAVALTMAGRVVSAGTLIDDFSNANTTLLSPPPNANVSVSAVGSTTVVDPGLAGVLGGVRTLTVYADALQNPGLDMILAGVSPTPGFLSYESTATGSGHAALLYDGGGAGLNANFLPAVGIRVDIFDLSTPPFDVTITLADTNMNSAAFTRTVLTADTGDLHFPFQDFPGVDLGSIFSVGIDIHPTEAGAEFKVDRIEAYRPVGAPLPLASPQGLLALVAVLLFVGRRAVRAS
jgi:hypothetical protein